MERKSLKELKSLILPEIEYHKDFIESMSGKTNPQVLDMVKHSEARLEALQDILRYIENGDKWQFIK